MSSEIPPPKDGTTSVCAWPLLGSSPLTLMPVLQGDGDCSITGSNLTQGTDRTAGIREQTGTRL